MTEIQTILDHCESRGGLNLSDISRWLDVHLTTVREWAAGREPRAYRLKYVTERLTKLKELVDNKPPGEPLIPCDVSLNSRASYLEKLKDEHLRILREDIA